MHFSHFLLFDFKNSFHWACKVEVPGVNCKYATSHTPQFPASGMTLAPARGNFLTHESDLVTTLQKNPRWLPSTLRMMSYPWTEWERELRLTEPWPLWSGLYALLCGLWVAGSLPGLDSWGWGRPPDLSSPGDHVCHMVELHNGEELFSPCRTWCEQETTLYCVKLLRFGGSSLIAALGL